MQNNSIIIMEKIANKNISWQDIQGLGWTLEESSFELNERNSVCA